MANAGMSEHPYANIGSGATATHGFPATETSTETRSSTTIPQSNAQATSQSDLSLSPVTILRGKSRSDQPAWDIRTLEYISEVDENLICPICQSPFVSPISLRCQHLFCRECLSETLNYQSDNKTCPSCRSAFDTDSILAVPKVIHRILDELRVKCPLGPKGCPVILPRGSIQTHLDKYCGYEDINCPSVECEELVPRRLAVEDCLHNSTPCPDCSEEVPTLAMDSHQAGDCKAIGTECPDCLSIFPRNLYEEHQQTCMEKIIACPASDYGCDFVGKRKSNQDHVASCPLGKLAPFIALQNARLDDHSRALKHLQRKTLLHETFLDTIKDTLAAIPSTELGTSASHADSTSTTDPLFDSPSSHLLSLHETLRQEVDRVSAAVSDLDAKTDTAFLNSSLRSKEEAAHRDAVIAQLRVQVQWLVSSRLQGMHNARMTGGVLGSSTRRGSDDEDPGIGNSRLPGLTRRGSDGLGTGGREKL